MASCCNIFSSLWNAIYKYMSGPSDSGPCQLFRMIYKSSSLIEIVDFVNNNNQMIDLDLLPEDDTSTSIMNLRKMTTDNETLWLDTKYKMKNVSRPINTYNSLGVKTGSTMMSSTEYETDYYILEKQSNLLHAVAYSTGKESYKITKWLIKIGVDKTYMNLVGDTPYDIAKRFKHTHLLSLLQN